MINEQIRDKEVQVIDTDGKALGVMLSSEALEIAISKELDLVKIVPNANPPVCKILDYGKYKFELSKKEKEVRKNQKQFDIKEMNLTPTIDPYHLDFKIKNSIKFLKDGDKVKVSIKFRGRQLSHIDIGEATINKFIDGLKDYGVIEKTPKLEGKNLFAIIAPKNN